MSKEIMEHDIESIQYQEGVDRGKWGIAEEPQFPNWPLMYFWVKASGRDKAKDRYYFRFELNGFNQMAPVGLLWDPLNDSALDFSNYPSNSVIVSKVFKKGGLIYAPCDRNHTHPEWANHPVYGEWFWRSGDSIVKYLNFLYMILKSAR